MKRQYTILLLVIIAFVACDNLDIKSGQSESFIKIFGSYNNDYGVDVKEFNDGYLLLATLTQDNNSNTDIAIIKTNNYGNQTKQETINEKGIELGSELLIANDGGFIVLGTCEDTSNNNKDIYVAKYNSAMSVEWKKFIGNVDDNEQGVAIDKLNEGYIIVGNTDAPNVVNGNPKGIQDILLVKINDLGETLWTNSFGGSDDDIASDVIADENGFAIIGTTSSFNEPEQAAKNIIVIKTNLAGFETDKLSYGGSFNDLGVSIRKSDDNGFIIMGTKEILSGGNSDIYLAHIESDIHNIKWEKTYGSSAANNICTDLFYSSNNLIVAGSGEEGSVKSAYFLKLDSDGNILVENNYGGFDAQLFNSIEYTNDGGYIMIGNSGFEGNEQICLLKVNSEGEL